MDVLAQPFAEIPELAGGQLGVKLRNVLVHALPELTGDQVPERVGGEVADRAERPMDVLKHSERVVGDVEPEVLLEAGVPRLG